LLGAVLPYLHETECLSAGTPDINRIVVGVSCIIHGMIFARQSQN